MSGAALSTERRCRDPLGDGCVNLCKPGARTCERCRQAKSREDRAEREERAAVAARRKIDAIRVELWELTSLSDRANGAVTDRAALERAMLDAKERLDDAERDNPDAPPAPTICGPCANPIPATDDDGDGCCFKCGRLTEPPQGWARGRNYGIRAYVPRGRRG